MSSLIVVSSHQVVTAREEAVHDPPKSMFERKISKEEWEKIEKLIELKVLLAVKNLSLRGLNFFPDNIAIERDIRELLDKKI